MKLTNLDSQQPKNDGNNFDEIPHLFSNLLVIIVLLIFIFLFLNIRTYQKIKDNDICLKEIQQLYSVVLKSNEEVSKQVEAQNKLIGKEEAQKQSKDFFNYFFKWGEWQQFSENMTYLRKTYPKVEKSKIVNISGLDVGTGNSPLSYYSSKTYITKDDGIVVNLVSQKKIFGQRTVITNWFVKSEIDNHMLVFEVFQPIKYRNLNKK